jgi:hypothetical protein
MSNAEIVEIISKLRSIITDPENQIETHNVDLSVTLALALKRLEKLDAELVTEVALLFIAVTHHLLHITENDLQERLDKLQERYKNLENSAPDTEDDTFWDTF